MLLISLRALTNTRFYTPALAYHNGSSKDLRSPPSSISPQTAPHSYRHHNPAYLSPLSPSQLPLALKTETSYPVTLTTRPPTVPQQPTIALNPHANRPRRLRRPPRPALAPPTHRRGRRPARRTHPSHPQQPQPQPRPRKHALAGTPHAARLPPPPPTQPGATAGGKVGQRFPPAAGAAVVVVVVGG